MHTSTAIPRKQHSKHFQRRNKHSFEDALTKATQARKPIGNKDKGKGNQDNGKARNKPVQTPQLK